MVLQGKNAIVTGARRGIGKAIVRSFAENGANVWACARKPDDEFEAECKSLSEKYGVWIKPVYFDMMDEEQIKTGIKSILSDNKQIDILVNNAGIAHGASFTMTSMKKMREVYEVNVFAQVQIMQLVGRHMMKNKSGCIINMCSIGGIATSAGCLAYGSSKAALIWITQMAAKEFGAYGIRVNGIAPGFIDTEMGHYKSGIELEKTIDRMTIKRMGKPEEIAKATVYVASDDASFMTGHIMVIDGGSILNEI
jgi:3-oxoacyl-[acyl-carrier protein] reductase